MGKYFLPGPISLTGFKYMYEFCPSDLLFAKHIGQNCALLGIIIITKFMGKI